MLETPRPETALLTRVVGGGERGWRDIPGTHLKLIGKRKTICTVHNNIGSLADGWVAVTALCRTVPDTTRCASDVRVPQL